MSVLYFRKMQGLGNDFMVIDAIHQQVNILPEQVCAWSNRHTGVGFDQLLLVEAPTREGVDFNYRIFNADGSQVSQCGNGARCFARFVQQMGLSNKTELTVETSSGIIVLYLEEDDVRVNMGAPKFLPSSLPLNLPEQSEYHLALPDGQRVEFGAVSIGNPHAVLLVDEVAQAAVTEIGSAMQARMDIFPEGINIGFAQIVDREHIKLRVYERGVGETQACGSGACAAMAICRQWGLIDAQVKVSLLGGDLSVAWSGNQTDVLSMTGAALSVFDGSIHV